MEMQGTRNQLKPSNMLRHSMNTRASKIIVKQGIPIDGTVRAVAIGRVAYNICEAERTSKLSSAPIRQPRFRNALYITCVVTVPSQRELDAWAALSGALSNRSCARVCSHWPERC